MQVTMDSNRDFHALILRELRSLRESMDAGFAQVDARFGRVEIRLDNVEHRLDGVEDGLQSLGTEMRTKFDGVAKLLIQHEQRLLTLERIVEKLIAAD